MKKFLIITIFILFPFTVKAVDSFPSFPMSFYGNATLNNVYLPIGTKIQAYDNDALKGEITIIEDGIYGYDNPTKNKLVVGEYSGALQFKYLPKDSEQALAGDSSIGYIEDFISGRTEELNLNFIKDSVQLNNDNSEAVITSADVATTTILIAQELIAPKINLATLISTTTTTSLVITPASLDIETTTSLGVILINIPSNSSISSTANWDGIMNAPTVKSNNSVSVTPDSGKTATVYSVIEVGFNDNKLIFDKAVRLLIPGQAGKEVGYYRSNTFTKITGICTNDSQSWADANLGIEGDCKINVGSDLVIWTKHFTKFATYTQVTTPTPAPSGGGGGGGGGGGSAFSTTPTPAVATTTEILEEVEDVEVLGVEYDITSDVNYIIEETIKKEKGAMTEININLSKRVSGRILLQVEEHGEAWYVNPKDNNKYYMANGDKAYGIMRYLSVGITNKDLERVMADKEFAKKHSGKIFLQVEEHGEAYYIDIDGNAHYLKDGAAAYTIMRELGLGITNNDLRKVEIGEIKEAE